MKVAVINFSGNVGKTTVAAQLLQPRMQDAPVFSIESINVDAAADGLVVEKLKGKRFGELRKKLMDVDSAIVDVGASNVEDFLRMMQQYEESHADYDLFVIPVVKEKKGQQDTINTIHALRRIGIPPQKIRVLFNKCDLDEAVEDDFSPLFGLPSDLCTVDAAATIYSNEVFEELKDVGKSLGQLKEDSTDYRAKLRTLTDPTERQECVHMIGIKMLAATANRNLDTVFKALMR